MSQEEDVDFLAKFSRLVNGMGQALVLSWTRLTKAADMKVAAETLQALEAKIPLMLQLLMHEDDDISANIVGFCYDYLHVLKQVHTHTHPQPIISSDPSERRRDLCFFRILYSVG